MIQAIFSDVIVKVHYEQMSNSIIIPDSALKQHAKFYGEVMSIGPECTIEIKVGDKIVFPRHEGFFLVPGHDGRFILEYI